MTLVDKLIVAAMAAAAVGVALLGWWLSRYPTEKRGGYLGNRWKR